MRKSALTAISTLLKQNDKVIFVGSDLGPETLVDAKKLFPNRVFMEGISEQHLIGFAAGLALDGFIPFVHTIGTFLTRRALEQIIVDVAIQNLPVKLIASGGGMVYAPLGPTHQSIDDFALMRSIPNMTISAPCDPLEMTQIIMQIAESPGPNYVRVAKGGEAIITNNLPNIYLGEPREISPGNKTALLTTGVLVHECLEAVEILKNQNSIPSIYHFPFIAPLNIESIINIINKHKNLIVVEEHLPVGGLFSSIADIIVKNNLNVKVHQLCLPNSYAVNYGTQKEHWRKAGLDSKSIAKYVVSIK